MRGASNLQRQLLVLARRHGVTRLAPCRLPLTSPPDHDTLILEGIASAPTLDVDRTRFAPYCFGASLPTSLPLLIEHDAARPAGVAAPYYDPQGTLRVRTSPLSGVARQFPAFSIGARIIHYQIHDADRRSFNFEVTQAELTEISLTQHPHLDAARVLQRMRPAAMAEFYGHAQSHIAVLTKLAQFLQREILA